MCVCVCVCACVRTAHSRAQRTAYRRCAQRSGASGSRTAVTAARGGWGPQATSRATQPHGQSLDARRGEAAAPRRRHGGGGGDRRLHLLQRLRARQLRARRAARGQGAASGGREARRALCRVTCSATMLQTRRAVCGATMLQTHTCTAAAHCTHIRGAGTRSQHGGDLTG